MNIMVKQAFKNQLKEILVVILVFVAINDAVSKTGKIIYSKVDDVLIRHCPFSPCRF